MRNSSTIATVRHTHTFKHISVLFNVNALSTFSFFIPLSRTTASVIAPSLETKYHSVRSVKNSFS